MFYVDYKNSVNESNEDNNWQEVPIKVEFLPDLTISQFRWIKRGPYDQLMAEVIIKNIGRGKIEIPAYPYPFLRGCLTSPKDSRWQGYCTPFSAEQPITLMSRQEYKISEFYFVGVPLPSVHYTGEIEIVLPDSIQEITKTNNKRKIAVTVTKWDKNKGLPDLEIVSIKFIDGKKAEMTFKNGGNHRLFYQPIAIYGEVSNIRIPEYKKIVGAQLGDPLSDNLLPPGALGKVMVIDPMLVTNNGSSSEPTEFIEGEEWNFVIDSGNNQIESNEKNNSKTVKVEFGGNKGTVDLGIENIHLIKSRVNEKFEASTLIRNYGNEPIRADLVKVTLAVTKDGRLVYNDFVSSPPPGLQELKPGSGAYYNISSTRVLSPNNVGFYDLTFYVMSDANSGIKDTNENNNRFNTNVLIDSLIGGLPANELPDLIIKDISFFEATSTVVSPLDKRSPRYGAKVTIKNMNGGDVCIQTLTVELRVSSTSNVDNRLFNPYSIGFSCKIIEAKDSEVVITLPTVDKPEYYFGRYRYLFTVDPYGYVKELNDENNAKEVTATAETLKTELIISLEPTTPPSQDIPIGSTDTEVARFKLAALYEDLTISSITMAVPNIDISSCNFNDLKLYSEGRLIGYVIPSATSGPAVTCHAQFNNLNFVIPRDTSKTIALKLSIPLNARVGDSFAFMLGGVVVKKPPSGKTVVITGSGTTAYTMKITAKP